MHLRPKLLLCRRLRWIGAVKVDTDVIAAAIPAQLLGDGKKNGKSRIEGWEAGAGRASQACSECHLICAVSERHLRGRVSEARANGRLRF